jgi:hypothetical protein
VWDPVARGYFSHNRSKTCSTCGGTSRSGYCYSCGGRTKLTCGDCNGSGWLDCRKCGKTGKLTLAIKADLVGRPNRAVRNSAGLPAEFLAALKCLPIFELPTTHGDVDAAVTEPENGAAAVRLTCTIPDVRVAMERGEVLPSTWNFVAIGKTACLPHMPTFLDNLLLPLLKEIEDAAKAGQAGKALALAKESRVTASVLKAVATTRGPDEEALSALWQQAVGISFVQETREALNHAYDGVGAHAIRRTWLMLGIPAVAIAAAAYPFDFGRVATARLPSLMSLDAVDAMVIHIVATFGVGMLPVLTVALVARWASRRAARHAVGLDARRVPSQGWWARVPMFASVLVLFAGAKSVVVPPFVQSPAVAQRYVHRVLSGGTAQAVPTVSKPAATTLSRSPLPALTAMWPPASFRGDTQVYVAQFGLGQLGFLSQQPDGIMNTATHYAIERLTSFLPRSRAHPTNPTEAALLAGAALRGEFRLERMEADRFVTAGMSNLARANLTGLDVEAIKAVAYRAYAEPGVERTWTSRDGLRGGRVLATRLPDGCADIDVEVRVRGAAERTGPTPACMSGGSWMRPNQR